ncbi:MAG: hypothetical protein ACLPSF_01740 [Methylocella sp.]
MKIAFLRRGAMGGAMARNLLKPDPAVIAWIRSEGRRGGPRWSLAM